MTRRFFTFLIFLLPFVFIFFSCARDKEKDNPFNHLHLNYYELFHANGRELIFFLETLETFPCSNFLISTEVTFSYAGIEIYSDNIEIPSVCITSEGPATRSLSLGTPGEKSGNVSLWVNQYRHDFELGIHAAHYDIKRKTRFDNRLSFSREKLMRIPDNTVWGYIVTESENKSDLTLQLLDAFTAKGAIITDLEPGEYHYFRIENTTPVFNLDKPTYGFTLLFNQNISLLVEAFEEFMQTAETTSHVQLRLFSTRGERFVM